MKVLGVSGSPIKNSNTDRALKAALDVTGMENGVHQKDDGIMLAEKAKEADAMIVAVYTPFVSGC
jgi:hypothetical protein